jgi:addiction module RelE/StbE family toxin
MIYDTVEFTKSFEKQFKKLSPAVQQKFYRQLELFMLRPRDPMLNNHALKGKYEGFRSINVTGDVRALFFRDQGRVVFFAHIGTHSQLYG